MGTAERKRLFESIVRLRRAEREAPQSRDLVAVRADLERELGETVSRSLAAQLLGVSHTALNRWVDAGDVPVVVTRDGRRAVPVAALVDLYEAVARERASGRRRRHALEPIMVESRAKARAMRPGELIASDESSAGPHRSAELRSLAYHGAVAKRLRRPMADDALHLIWQWRDSGRIDRRYADRWEEVLRGPLPEIRKLLTSDSQAAADLRQNSPFAGLLSEPERRKILAEIG